MGRPSKVALAIASRRLAGRKVASHSLRGSSAPLAMMKSTPSSTQGRLAMCRRTSPRWVNSGFGVVETKGPSSAAAMRSLTLVLQLAKAQ
ncbi:MAG: hypothetical protein AUK47_20055 [Deltaproteobacteria bacterium CG2_30_63_29]|nr:MAG: hypothetical protein AUK47_20055 [Deltaproteobacteria bacterium CG2_30_63_29]